MAQNKLECLERMGGYSSPENYKLRKITNSLFQDCTNSPFQDYTPSRKITESPFQDSSILSLSFTHGASASLLYIYKCCYY